MYFRLSATPGSEETRPREARVVHRRPLFRRQIVGLLCGKGVEPPRGRGRPSGDREWQVFLGYIITKMFSKIHLDIMTFTTEKHYIIRMIRYALVANPPPDAFIDRHVYCHLPRVVSFANVLTGMRVTPSNIS